MAGPSERDAYPFWVAMGAAFVGTLLGGGAVWLGVGHRLDAIEASSSPLEVVEPAGVDTVEEIDLDEAPPEHPREAPQALTDDEDPGDSPLVRAVAATRDSVVTLEIGGAVGAGVVYDDSGVVLTNYHVIEPALRAQMVFGQGATHLRARFVDGRERAAKVMAADAEEDIAILRLVPEREDERFAAAPLGHSAALRLGEQVFAIGSPVGFEGTVATGIVSALARTQVLAKRQLPLLQLDAAINFGNSGGPLFNLAGELVGITTARSSRGEGIGFAIPIDRVRLFLRSLEQGTHGRSGMIGVVLEPRVEIAARIEALGYHSGVVVGEVLHDRPAASAGMRPGDVIVSLRGRRHDDLDAGELGRMQFAALVGDTIRSLLPGERLAVEVVRDGEVVPLELVIEAASVREQARIDAEELLGLQLDPEREDTKIIDLVPGSAIARIPQARALKGARIVSLFGKPVADDREALVEQLAALRSWTASGGRPRIAIAFETPEGELLTTNKYPLAGAR